MFNINKGTLVVSAVILIIAGTYLTLSLKSDPKDELLSTSGTVKNASNLQIEIVNEPKSDFSLPEKIRPIIKTYPSGTRVEEITFANGEILEVAFISAYPQPPPIYPTRKLADMYDILALAAENGDVGAARELYKNLWGCNGTPSSIETHNSQIDKLWSTSSYISFLGDAPSEIKLSSSDLELREKIMREQFEFCLGVTQDKIDNRSKWIELAAEGGDRMAIETVALSLGQTKESFELYRNAWNDGWVGVGYGLAMKHGQGIPGLNGGKPDLIRQYAFTLATNTIWASALNYNESATAANKISDLDTALVRLSAVLSALEQEKAEKLAASLIRDNKKCCKGGWEGFGI